MSISVKNNTAALLTQFLQSSSTQGNQGKLSLENAGKMLQMLGQMMTTLKTLQDSIQGQGDSFGGGSKPGGTGGAGGANGTGGAGGAEGTNPLIQQFLQLLQTLSALQNPQGQQGAGGGQPGAQGGAPGAPGAQGGAPGAQGGAPGAQGGVSLPFAAQAQVLNNVKQEQAALMGKISEGVKSGKITPQELGKLMQGVQKLAEATRAASADGNVTAEEAVNLQKMSMENITNTKSAFENGDKASFASINPASQQQAQQLNDIAQGLADGSISNLELTDLAEEQGALAEAQGNVSSTEDASKLLQAQQLTDLTIQMARLTGNKA
ncbi:hypothetical protein [Cystobacter fuscus]|uniref:hypothetical protein n=1 Tax=Cystobacter fuscus TaxID=43 RepID=UPI0037C116C0